MDQKVEILLRYFRENKSQRQISKELGISRTTVQKYIKEFESKSEILEVLKEDEDRNKAEIYLLIDEMASEPKYDTSNRSKTKLTDEVIKEIDELITENEKNRLAGRSKQLMKKVDIHEKLVDKGFDIGYTTVCNYIKETYETKEAYIRQFYDLGETLEFDWGEVKLTIDGREVVLNMGLFTTAKGSYHFARLYHNQKMENFLDIHVKAFNKIGGVHREVVYDNMKQAVKRFVGRNEKEDTEDLLKLSMYYGFKYRFCNARRGNEKGHVERSVEYVRRKVFSKKDSFETLEEANEYLEEELKKLNSKPQKHNENKSAKEFLEEELPHLIKLVPSYDISRVVELRVNKYSVINIEENKYSVPDSLVGKFVTAKIYPNNILVYHENELVAEHVRSFGANTWNIKIEHYLNTLKKKPGAIHRSTAMRQMNSKLQDIYTKYYTQNPKDFIDLIELISKEGLEKIEESINELEKINPLNIDTEKIKLLCNRQEEIVEESKYKNTEIEEHSRLILNHYGDLLKNSSEDFDKEALII